MNGNKAVTANFTQNQYTLTITTQGQGSVTKNPNQTAYHSGTNVILTATPVSGWSFSSWSGDLSGNNNPVTITMGSNKIITAYFTENTNPVYYDLVISVDGNGTTDPAPGTYSYLDGSTVCIDAIADSCWTFDHWSGDVPVGHELDNPLCIVIDMNSSIVANFVKHPHNHTLNISIIGNGTTNPSPGVYSYSCGTVVNLSATADPGWVFDHWEGNLTGKVNHTSIVINSNKSVKAIFVEETEDTIPPKVNITKPKNNTLYKDNKEIRSLLLKLLKTRIIGPITIEVDASDEGSGVDKVEFYINNKLNYTGYSAPYNWTWDEKHLLPRLYTIKVIAYDKAGNNNSDTIKVRKMGDFNLFRNRPLLSLIIVGGFIVWKILDKSGDDGGEPGDEEAKDNPPVADAGGPYNGKISEEIQFDGSGSSDSDGSIVSYYWEFGDGTSDTEVSPTHKYQKEGEYKVILTVTDSSGLSQTSETTVTISPLESKEESENDNIYWYIVSGLGTCLLVSLGVLYFRRKFYV